VTNSYCHAQLLTLLKSTELFLQCSASAKVNSSLEGLAVSSPKQTVFLDEHSQVGQCLSVMIKRPCKFYNTTGKCAFGKHCRFSHEIKVSNTPSSNTEVDNGAVSQLSSNNQSTALPSTPTVTNNSNGSLTRTTSQVSGAEGIFDPPSSVPSEDGRLNQEKAPVKALCRFFASHNYCHFGKRCRFEHVRSTRTKPEQSRKDDVLVKRDDSEDKNNDKQEEVQDEEKPVAKDDNKHATSKLGQRGPKVCKFFKQGHCRNGRSCRFFHPSIKPEKEVEQVVPVTENKEPPLPVDDGFQQVVRKPRVINVYERKDIDDAKQAELRQTEIKQLKRRFPADKIRALEESASKAAFVVTFLPTDPDWVGETFILIVTS